MSQSSTETQQYTPEDTILATNHDENSSNTVVNRVVAVKNFLRKESDLVGLPFRTLWVPSTEFNEILITLGSQQRQENHTLLQEFALHKAIAMQGDARGKIVRKVSELNADGLILGSHGLEAIKRMLLNSVSDQCAHNCHFPKLNNLGNDGPDGKSSIAYFISELNADGLILGSHGLEAIKRLNAAQFCE
ncbi:hypothetical protein Glove_141g91 [Diversispora epigaea]|uniref:UspA domain-containing protein n=1 Tax=Diversispora epigaea TaxID=1348612 RepID=A0A397IZB0_9GLOM|nr:hypothetical protein Glove_141g91 [Diversispora epigaea]